VNRLADRRFCPFALKDANDAIPFGDWDLVEFGQRGTVKHLTGIIRRFARHKSQMCYVTDAKTFTQQARHSPSARCGAAKFSSTAIRPSETATRVLYSTPATSPAKNSSTKPIIGLPARPRQSPTGRPDDRGWAEGCFEVGAGFSDHRYEGN